MTCPPVVLPDRFSLIGQTTATLKNSAGSLSSGRNPAGQGTGRRRPRPPGHPVGEHGCRGRLEGRGVSSSFCPASSGTGCRLASSNRISAGKSRTAAGPDVSAEGAERSVPEDKWLSGSDTVKKVCPRLTVTGSELAPTPSKYGPCYVHPPAIVWPMTNFPPHYHGRTCVPIVIRADKIKNFLNRVWVGPRGNPRRRGSLRQRVDSDCQTGRRGGSEWEGPRSSAPCPRG